MSETTTPAAAPLSGAASDPRYPVGRFAPPPAFTPETRAAAIEAIAGVPAALRAAVAGLSDARLDTPYRPGGWTVRQVVHHVADSHMNAYIRFKLAATEDTPTIKPYSEERWAELPEARTAPIEMSLALLEGLHARWTAYLRAMSEPDFARAVFHPEHQRQLTADFLLAMYAWHGRHHVAHITALRAANGW